MQRLKHHAHRRYFGLGAATGRYTSARRISRREPFVSRRRRLHFISHGRRRKRLATRLRLSEDGRFETYWPLFD